ncbi:MAG: stringent starvation protein A [Gammaproteobacteria bacterium]|nr:stringent starvation protein A [Gammaproteobacteria bacterium]MBT6754716.1 stringent starvation protein A [Gammaproteobacteria bacterium]MBT7523086.1 stringent starvation protein A [Gammaproteobacteria bacterium]MBT7814841.1 stringent starvation protein A [Gammaproteobacteria bacterium]MDC3386592.1 glutathione S-transferase N-terminal domain-containing protein [Gammaproteobacteria bacterium]
MTLYSDPNSAQSHRVRIVLGEKDLIFNVEDIISGQNNEDLIALNPNNTTPTFVDRNLVLYESRVIMEYLDERFPHPPLMPVDPVIRAKTRMVLHYIEKDLYGLLDDIKSSGEKKSSTAKIKLKENLMLSLDFIQGKNFFLSDDFSIIDCSMAPILWRLPEYGIELPKSAKPILKYAEKLFERTSFVENLSEQEEEMRSIY